MLNTFFNQEKCNIYETVSLIETRQQQEREQTPRSPRVILKKFSDDVVKPKVKKLLLKKSNSCSTAHNLFRNSFNGKSLSEFSSMLPIQAENSTSTSTKTIHSTTLQKNISYDSGQSCNSCLSSSTYSAEVSISNSQTNFGKIESISELPEIEMAERNRLTSKDSDDTTPRNSKNSKEEIVESFPVTKVPSSSSYAHNPPRKMQSISSDSYSLSRQTSNSSRSSFSNFSRQSSISQKSNSSISQGNCNPISNSKRRYRATDIWNNLVENFTSKMPIKRHTVHLGLRTYEESFSGRDAVDFIHNYLINSPDFDAAVSREQAVMVLCKFFEQNIILLAKERFERAQILKNSCNSIFSSNNFEIRNLANFSYLESQNSQDAQKLRSLQNSSISNHHCCAHGSMINKPGYKPSTSCTEKRKNSFRDDNTIYCFNEKYSEMRHRSRSSFTSTRQSVSKFVSLNNMAILGFSEKSILDLSNTSNSNQPLINEINKNDPTTTMTQSARLSQVAKPVSKFYNLCSRRQSTGALLKKPFDRNFMLGHGRNKIERVEKDEALVVDDCPCDSVMQNSIPTSSSNHDLRPFSSSGVDSKRNSILYRGYDANDSSNFSMPSSRSAFCLSDIAKSRKPSTEQSYPPTARNTAQSPRNHKSPVSKPTNRRRNSNSKPKSSVPIELLVNQINGPDGIFSDCHHLGTEGHLAENFDQTVDLNSPKPMRKSRIRISVESAEESPITPTPKRDQCHNRDRRNSSTSTCSVDNHVSDLSSPIRNHFSGIFTPKKNKDISSKSKHSLSLTPAKKLVKKLVNSPLRKSNQKQTEQQQQPTISSLLKQHTKKLETIWPDQENLSQDTQDVLMKISENQQEDRNSREMNVYEKQRRNSPQETDEPKPIRRKSIKRNKSDGLMLENLDFANSVVIDKNNGNSGFANDCVTCGSHLDAIVDDDDVF